MLLRSTKAELLIGLYCRLIVRLDVQDDLVRSFSDHALQASGEQRAAEPAPAIVLAQPHNIDLTEGWDVLLMPFQPVKAGHGWGTVLTTVRIPQEEHVGRIEPFGFHPAV